MPEIPFSLVVLTVTIVVVLVGTISLFKRIEGTESERIDKHTAFRHETTAARGDSARSHFRKREEKKGGPLQAAVELADLCNASRDLEAVFRQFAYNQPEDSGQEVPLHQRAMFLALAALTRTVAMIDDRLRDGDSARLAAFAGVLLGRESEFAEQSHALYALRMAESEMQTVLLPIFLLAQAGSSDARLISRKMLAYGRSLASFHHDTEVVFKRLEALHVLRRALRKAEMGTNTDASQASWHTTDAEQTRYDLFGLDLTCTNEELRAAYREKVKAWHPDRMQQLPVELQAIAETKLALLNNTYDDLLAARQV